MKFNGNLVLNSGGASEVQNVILERVSSLPSVQVSEKGRIIFLTSNATYYFNDGATWSPFATGGDATALQGEVNNIETTLGTGANSDGTFNTNAFTGYAAGATSFTDALAKIQLAITGHDALSELTDVGLFSVAQGQVLFYNSTSGLWVNHTLLLTDVSDVTSTASEVNQLAGSGVLTADLTKLHAVTSTAAALNILTGATLTTTELNYVDGVTSAIQTQLNNKQPLNASLTSIALLTPATDFEFIVGHADGSFTLNDEAGQRTALGLAIGSNVQAWDADLDTIAGFAPAADSSETLTINTTSITHVGINDVMVATGGVEGSRWTLKRGASARTSFGLGNIAIMDEASFIRADVASSNIAHDIAFNNYKITNLAPGVSGTDAINLNQLQSFVAGLSWKNAVVAATTANITLTGEQTIDGVAVVTGNRVLVKNQTSAADNGIYVVASGAWARSSDFDALADNVNSAAVFVEQGTTQNDTGWTQTADLATFGTDAQTWIQFNGAAGVTAGIGLNKNGNQIDINLGAGIVELPSDEVGIDLYDPTSSAIILTTDATARSTATNAKLHLLLDLTGNGKLVQSASGLKVDTNTITPAELTASVAGAGLVGGNGTALAVVSAAGTGSTGGDNEASWAGVGTVVVTADAVGVELGSTSTSAAPGNHTHKASVITFSNTASGLTATSVQGAIDELDGRTDTLESNSSNLQTEVNAIETAVGLTTAGALVPFSGTNYVDTASTIANAVSLLDTAINTVNTAITTRIDNGCYVYSGASATTHVVTHNTGSQYNVVTVIDGTTDEVIIPNSITFDTANQLTVTVNVALAIKVVVVGF